MRVNAYTSERSKGQSSYANVKIASILTISESEITEPDDDLPNTKCMSVISAETWILTDKGRFGMT